MEIFREFWPAFATGVVVGMLFILAACAYYLIKADKDIERLEKSRDTERKECARLTKENQALREANQQIDKERFEEGLHQAQYFLNEVKA
jgi:hypothetical protein